MADDRPEMERLLKRDVYLNPTLDCDMVMKGGITSGVVYPLAVCELATKYRFHSVGGSSAGAIAAALCAAAELGRASEKGGFHRLASLPKYLAGNDYLLKLFQPSQKTRPLFNLLVFFLNHRASEQNPGFLGWILAALRETWRAPGGAAWFLSRLLLLLGIASGGAYLASTMGSAVVALLTLLALLVVVVLILRCYRSGRRQRRFSRRGQGSDSVPGPDLPARPPNRSRAIPSSESTRDPTGRSPIGWTRS